MWETSASAEREEQVPPSPGCGRARPVAPTEAGNLHSWELSSHCFLSLVCVTCIVYLFPRELGAVVTPTVLHSPHSLHICWALCLSGHVKCEPDYVRLILKLFQSLPCIAI